MSSTEDDEESPSPAATGKESSSADESLRIRRVTFAHFGTPTSSKLKAQLEQKFLYATYLTNVPAIKKCIQLGVNPNCVGDKNDMEKMAAIHIGAERGDVSVLKVLLSCEDIRINMRSGHGFTALQLACIFNKPRYALTLLENGANPDLPDRIQRSPLHLCLISESYKIIFHLIRFGANINVLDSFSRTPLSICLVEIRNIFIAKFLLNQEADLYYLEEKRPLHIFFEAILNCDHAGLMDYVTLLLDFGLDVNTSETIFGRNCLHFVGITGFLPLAIILVQRGAMTNVKDYSDRTPLDVARIHGNHAVADFYQKGYTAANLLKAIPLLLRWKAEIKNRPTMYQTVDEDDDDEEDAIN